jgi:acetyl-CoA carboxylase biotin carboxyl carrier protein
MDIRKIKKLIELLHDSDVAEIEISEGDDSVRISRGNANQVTVHGPRVASSQVGTPSTQESIPISSTEENQTPSGHQIKSPMVGTFFRSPSPDSGAFIEIGSTISPGDPLCIIEAMKMMNQIESDFSGTVIAILVHDGDPIEFDQPLMVIG